MTVAHRVQLKLSIATGVAHVPTAAQNGLRGHAQSCHKLIKAGVARGLRTDVVVGQQHMPGPGAFRGQHPETGVARYFAKRNGAAHLRQQLVRGILKVNAGEPIHHFTAGIFPLGWGQKSVVSGQHRPIS